MTTSEQQAVPVAQEDREAAWQFMPESYRTTEPGALTTLWHQGVYDTIPIIQAFARHRLASLPCKSGEGAGDGLRAAAEKARAQFQFYADEHGNAGKYEKARTNAGFAEMLELALSEDATQTREAEGQAFLDAFDAAQEDGGHVLWKAATDAADTYRAALNARGGA